MKFLTGRNAVNHHLNVEAFSLFQTIKTALSIIFSNTMENRNQKHTLTILWRIKNIRVWKSCYVISSPEFTPRVLDGRPFKLYLSQMGPEREVYSDDNYLVFSLQHLDGEFDIMLDCEVTRINHDGSHFVYGILRNQVAKNKYNVVLSSYIKDDLIVTQANAFFQRDNLTLRFRIWKSIGDFIETEFFSMGTLLKVPKTAVEWPIPKVSTLKLNQEVTTPIRIAFFDTSIEFLLTFSFKGPFLDLAIALAQLEVVSNSKKLPYLMWQVCIRMNEDDSLKFIESKWGCQNIEIGRRCNLLNFKYCDLQNDILRLHCEITKFYATGAIEKISFGCPNPDRYLSTTTTTQPYLDSRSMALRGGDSREDIEKLYRDKNATDFELRLGKVSFPVHKVVLSARSSFFRNMFSGNFSHFETNSLEICNLDTHTLFQMLNFLYTGSVDGLDWENAVRLYHAANMYQVQSLLRECRSIFISTINVRNVSDTLYLAETHKDDELKSLVHCTISRSFSQVVESPDWAKFMERNPELAVKSMHQSYLKRI